MSQVKKNILKCLPGWTIQSVVFLGEGDFCAAYLVNDKWIFRFAKHLAALESLRREVCLLPKLFAQITLPIPLPEVNCFDERNVKTSFIAYRILPGRALVPGIYDSLSDENKTSIAEQTAYFLNQMHSANTAAAENCGVPQNDYVGQYSYLQNQARKFLFPVINQTERDFIERTVEKYLKSADNFNFRPALLHGDLSHDHLLYDKTTNFISGVIDFGDMMIGDPAWDFLWLYEDFGADFFRRVLRFYQTTEESDLVKRVDNYSLLQAIEWAADCSEKNDARLGQAVAKLRSKIKKNEN